jgi:hypothetical protein
MIHQLIIYFNLYIQGKFGGRLKQLIQCVILLLQLMNNYFIILILNKLH